MFIEHVTLQLYKPLLFGGITGIDFPVTEQVLCVIGNNGSGKSSLLAELTPLPSVSSSYEKGGFKRLTIAHDGYTYIVSSTFEGKSGIHSFIKEGVELNESGTSGVQTELVEREFGLNESFKQLCRGVVDICDMPIPNRKKFFYGCYPSDLSFLIDKHKSVCSEIRNIGANIKMLLQRKAEIESEMIPTEAYQALSVKLDRLLETKEALLQQKATYSTRLEQCMMDPTYDPDAPELNPEELLHQLFTFQREVGIAKHNHPGVSSKDAQTKVVQLVEQITHLDKDEHQLDIDIQNLVAEVDRFERLSREMSTDHITTQHHKIQEYKKTLEALVQDPKVPLVPKELLLHVNQSSLQDWIMGITAPLVHPKEFSDWMTKHHEVEQILLGSRMEQEQLNRERIRIEQQLPLSGITSFKVGCVETCPARQAAQTTYDTLNKELMQVTAKLKDLTSGIEQRAVEFKALTQQIESQKDNQVYCTRILSELSELAKYFEGDLLSLLIENPSGVYNRYLRLYDQACIKERVQELTNTLEREERTLATLYQAKQEKEKLLEQFNSDKINHLDKLKDKYAKIKETKTQLSSILIGYKKIAQQSSTFQQLEQYIYQTLQTAQINANAQWFEEAITGIDVLVNTIEHELVSTKSILKQQESFRIRIHQEITPNLAKLNEELLKLKELEQVLSPISGISHVHMVRFLNQIIHHTNLILSSVWNYEMDIEPFKEEHTLEYQFKINLQNRGTVVDQVLSKSQKEIVNFALFKALYHVRKLGDTLPFKLDEIDSGMTPHHRSALLSLLSEIISLGHITQLILVNHHSTLFSGFPQAQIVVLDPEGIILPNEYNTQVTITRK